MVISDDEEEFVEIVEALRPLVESLASTSMGKEKLFSCCLRSSLVRAFEFLEVAIKTSPDEAFFLTPSLRGITEDLILLRYLSQIPHKDRETVINGLMVNELRTQLGNQTKFFDTFRPFQPVMRRPLENNEATQIVSKVRDVFRKHGWPKLRKLTPPTREIAQKSEAGVLEVVYDFIYRMTSGFVHFNPKILFGLGWGPTRTDTTFSTKNMGLYYANVSRIYGAYLLCLYFEYFGRFLKPGDAGRDKIAHLRKYLLKIFRWPEMVTFEEMNIVVPKPEGWATSLYFVKVMMEFDQGFSLGAKRLLSSTNVEHQEAKKEVR